LLNYSRIFPENFKSISAVFTKFNIFAGLMDLGTGLSNSAYEKIVKHLYDAVKFVFDATCSTRKRRDYFMQLESLISVRLP